MGESSNVPYDTISRQSYTRKSCCLSLRTRCFVLGYLNLCANLLFTLEILAFTTFFGVVTHGFDHFDNERPYSTDLSKISTSDVSDIKSPNKIGIVLIVVLIANALWLIINIAALVGLHLKRPGPILVFVGFACARLIIVIVWFMFVIRTDKAKTHTMGTHPIYFSISAYYIRIYYVYAVQLEREREAAKAHSAPSSDVNPILPSNLYAIHPTNVYPTLDKSHIVA